MKLISDYILSILPFDIQDSIQYLKGGIKSINKSSFYSLPSFLADEKDITNVNDSGSLLSIIGLIILGGGVVLVVILTGDYIAPATMWWIPGMETILDQLYSTGNYILSWFQSPQIDNSPKLSPTSPRFDLPTSATHSLPVGTGLRVGMIVYLDHLAILVVLLDLVVQPHNH